MPIQFLYSHSPLQMPIQLICGQSSITPHANPINLKTVITTLHGNSINLWTAPNASAIYLWWIVITTVHKLIGLACRVVITVHNLIRLAFRGVDDCAQINWIGIWMTGPKLIVWAFRVMDVCLQIKWIQTL